MDSKQYEVAVSPLQAMSLIETQFPDIHVSDIQLIGEGWDNFAYLVNRTMIFRFPHRRVAAPLIEREIKVLSQISSKLPLALPKPQWIGQPDNSYPFPFYGYINVMGTTGCHLEFTLSELKEYAASLGRFLKALHSLDYQQLDTEGLDDMVFDRTNHEVLIKQFNERIADIADYYELEQYERLCTQMCADTQKIKLDNRRCLIHGDLYHRHLVFNNERHLIGIIDWGDTGISHPAIDLGVVYQFLPQEAQPAFYAEYGEVSEHSIAYAKFLGLYYSIALLWYGHKIKDQHLTMTSLMTLNRLQDDYLKDD